MGVMNDLVVLQSLDSILEMSNKNELSFDQLKDLSISMNQTLPLVSQSIAVLDEQIAQGFNLLDESQDRMESSLKDVVQDLKSGVAKLEALEDFASGERDRQETTRILWQKDLETVARSVQKTTETHLELQIQNLRLDVRNIVDEELGKKQPSSPGLIIGTITAAFNLLGSGVAGAVGAMLAITAQARPLASENMVTTDLSFARFKYAKTTDLPVMPLEYAETRPSSASKELASHRSFVDSMPFGYEHYQRHFHSHVNLEGRRAGDLLDESMPYQCSHCQKGFPQKDEWKDHVDHTKGCGKYGNRRANYRWVRIPACRLPSSDVQENMVRLFGAGQYSIRVSVPCLCSCE
ncbi:hypothetical protein BDZ45DRAFT_222360 [Acephala macrosclerotiorum]|nr:hypothetical protein BDZ45DRAFT_222360 [Acephala macrosclerotiorum]